MIFAIFSPSVAARRARVEYAGALYYVIRQGIIVGTYFVMIDPTKYFEDSHKTKGTVFVSYTRLRF